LQRMIPSPLVFLQKATYEEIHRTFADYKHRVTTGHKFACMLFGLKQILEHHGSLLPALTTFTTELTTCADDKLSHLVPCPTNRSACKRLNLFLRWMVRQDQVDTGGWEDIPASKLIVPVDIHMHRVGLSLGMTKRKQANMVTAKEITEGFRQICPEDPVKYDFALTRLGMKGDAELSDFLNA
ncbi:MAG: TIGR02757 family protein, partial [Deltaproteobacteria bacterium]|nr:TIGR02757 family protein [Deltaproteobacteria bacterium]